MLDNAYRTGCLASGKPCYQVIDKTVAHYLKQTAQPHETIRERLLKRGELPHGLQSGVFTLTPEECQKRPPATGECTTSHTVLPTRHMEDIWPYSRTEMTNKTITCNTIHSVFMERLSYVNTYVC